LRGFSELRDIIKGERKLSFMKEIARAVSIVLVLLMMLVTLTALPTQAQVEGTEAHGGAPELTPWPTSPPSGVTPSVTVDCTAFMSISPNPVGLNQPFLVNLWQEPPTHYNRYRSGYVVTITKPDGTTDTVGPINSYQGDTTAWFTYVADQVGTWELKFSSDGNYFPAGWYTRDGLVYNTSVSGSTFLDSAFYKAASTEDQELTVQQDMVASWPPSALPTDYWTRPIAIGNREWWIIGGQYPFTGQGGGPDWPAGTNAYASNYKFVPYVQAPNSPHIVWMRQGALGGIVGGQYGYSSYGPGEGTYAGTPNIIFQGRCYQSVTEVFDGVTQSVWQCYDLRTGEVYWEKTGVTTPTYVVKNYLLPSVPGAEQTGLGQGGSTNLYHLVAISGGRLIKYNPWNGNADLNISIPVTNANLYTEPFVLSVQNLGSSVPEGERYRLINWTVYGSDTDFANRVMSNVSYPFSSLGTADFESMVAVSASGITNPGMGTSGGTLVRGASLITGSSLWNVTTDDITFSGSTGVADHGKFTVRMLGGWWDCWDLYSGNFVWKSEKPAYPWGDFGDYNIASYAGLFYDFSYAGIYAFNWTNGKVVWVFNPEYPGYETPFASYPWFTNPIIAEGKLYMANGEHSPTQPLSRGWKLYCINATTGEGVWNITSGGSVGGISDGYLTFDSRYSGYMYIFGKGQSATTVTATQTTISKGDSVVIEGTVLDMSPAQPGTPCVSKDSMTTYMEYLHMQNPIDGIYHNVTVTGVPVLLLAIDSSGKVIDLGTTTSDVSGTFGMAWTPQDEGLYKITATFAGDDSYGSSWAETHVLVGPALETPQLPEQPVVPDPTMTIVAAAIAIIIAVAIATVLILRKR
jgi:outer membrane protein assembly factor BamB